MKLLTLTMQPSLQCQREDEQVYLETKQNPAYGFSQASIPKFIMVHTNVRLHYLLQPRECVQLSSSKDEPEYEQVDVSAETGFTISTNIAYSTVNL